MDGWKWVDDLKDTSQQTSSFSTREIQQLETRTWAKSLDYEDILRTEQKSTRLYFRVVRRQVQKGAVVRAASV